jgi:predicted amidohydrolase
MLLPEHAVTGGLAQEGKSGAAAKALSYAGPIEDFFAARAKQYNSYITVPMHEERDGKYYNSIVLLDRQGKRVGSYDKCFPVVDKTWNGLEDGITPAKELPVFDCDFGRLGLQICFDISNDAAWQQLEDAGVEVVGWCTASPQTIMPQKRAIDHGYWIVTSTMRNNASIIEPHTGFIHAQSTSHYDVMVREIDLSTLRLFWMPGLHDGKVFTDRFGDRVGFNYSEREDCGLFWSNDSAKSIRQMAEELGLLDRAERVERSAELNPHR